VQISKLVTYLILTGVCAWCALQRNSSSANLTIHIVADLLEARTVEAEEQASVGDGPYTRSRGTRHAIIEEVLQAAFSVGPRPR
jgi:hypothetical protein